MVEPAEVDSIVDQLAREQPSMYQVEVHPANWELCAPEGQSVCPGLRPCYPDHRRQNTQGTTWCPTAGLRRNQRMAEAGAAGCIAHPWIMSTGTWDMLRRARAVGIEPFVFDERGVLAKEWFG